jgi:hypothetical protein
VGLSPSQLQSAYGLQSAWAGTRQTVAVVTAFDDPNAEADMGTYRAQFNLPPCTSSDGCFKKVDQTGGSSYPQPGWSFVDAEALDMISAVCPNCHILLVEANSASVPDLGAAENEAVALGAKFIANDWITAETSQDTSYDTQYFNHPGVAITAPAGNSGYGVNYPAASQYVTAVGGTTLTPGGGSRGWTESVWSGTGSGCSAYDPKPSWQKDTACSGRTLNDLAAVADPSTGSAVAVYDTPTEGGNWVLGGGTAVAAAIVAAAYALAGTPASGTYPASYPYAHPGGSYTTPGTAYPYAAGLNDITSGSNGTCSTSYLCTAGSGYDGPTGLGSPSFTASLSSSGSLTSSVYSGVTDKCMDDPGDANMTQKIQIYSCLGNASQAWTVEADGTLQINGGGYCLDAKNGGPLVQLYHCNGTATSPNPNQQWTSRGDGTLRNQASGQCLTDPSGSTTNGTQLQVSSCSATAADEQWTLPYPVPSSTGEIHSQVPPAPGSCVDDRNARTTDGNPLQINNCTGNGAQTWTVEPDGTLQVLGKCMATISDGTTNGTLMGLYSCNGDTSQHWVARSDGSLLNFRSGIRCLDDPNASTTPGTQLQIWGCTGANVQQRWTLP